MFAGRFHLMPGRCPMVPGSYLMVLGGSSMEAVQWGREAVLLGLEGVYCLLVSPKAPLVMKQLLPSIFLFHFSSKKKTKKKLFSTPGNFLTVRDPPDREKFEIIAECWC